MASADRHTHPREDRASRRERRSFSCSAEVWDQAKKEWAAQRRTYWAWTDWLEAAIEEQTQRAKDALGVSSFDPAPDPLPPGRRPGADGAGRARHSFTCLPEVWTEAKAAWWAQLDDYLMWSDWVEAAIAEKTRISREQQLNSEITTQHHHQPT